MTLSYERRGGKQSEEHGEKIKDTCIMRKHSDSGVKPDFFI